jgi:hypothetical protein
MLPLEKKVIDFSCLVRLSDRLFCDEPLHLLRILAPVDYIGFIVDCNRCV